MSKLVCQHPLGFPVQSPDVFDLIPVVVAVPYQNPPVVQHFDVAVAVPDTERAVATVGPAGPAENAVLFGNIDHFSTPGLVTRLTTDITNVQMAYMFTIRLLARAPIMIVMSLIMTVTISPAIAFMMLITIPVLGGLSQRKRTRILSRCLTNMTN